MVRSIDQFEVNVEVVVGLGGPAIAGGKRDPVFGCRGGDEGIVNGAAGDAERRQAWHGAVARPGR